MQCRNDGALAMHIKSAGINGALHPIDPLVLLECKALVRTSGSGDATVSESLEDILPQLAGEMIAVVQRRMQLRNYILSESERTVLAFVQRSDRFFVASCTFAHEYLVALDNGIVSGSMNIRMRTSSLSLCSGLGRVSIAQLILRIVARFEGDTSWAVPAVPVP